MAHVSGGIASEFREVPDVLERQARRTAAALTELVARLKRSPPQVVVTCARGSSDHAATFAKYLIETHARVITSSAAPSLSSIYDASTNLNDVVFIAISVWIERYEP